MAHYFFVGTLKKGILQFSKEEGLICYHIKGGVIIRKEIVYDDSVKKEEVTITDENNLESFMKYLKENEIIMA